MLIVNQEGTCKISAGVKTEKRGWQIDGTVSKQSGTQDSLVRVINNQEICS